MPAVVALTGKLSTVFIRFLLYVLKVIENKNGVMKSFCFFDITLPSLSFDLNSNFLPSIRSHAHQCPGCALQWVHTHKHTHTHTHTHTHIHTHTYTHTYTHTHTHTRTHTHAHTHTHTHTGGMRQPTRSTCIRH
jgi:hypothetical protein